MFRKRKEELLAKMGLDPAALRQATGRIQVLAASSTPAALAYRDRLQRVMAGGAEMPATVRSFTVGEAEPQMGGDTVELALTVEPPDGDPYQVSIDQILPAAISATLAADQRVTVKVAPDDPQCVMLWNTPHAAGGANPDTGRPLDATDAAGAPDAAGDRIARLEQLQELRSSGVLTDEEFEVQKAKILASD